MLNNHDKLVLAMAKILSIYGWEVNYNIKGRRYEIKGNSGSTHLPDIHASRGSNIIGEIRTRGQRGRGNEIDRGVVEMFNSKLEDFRCMLERPRGIIFTPWGITKGAKKLSKHYGISVVKLPLDVAEKIINLDVISEKNKILEETRKVCNDRLFR